VRIMLTLENIIKQNIFQLDKFKYQIAKNININEFKKNWIYLFTNMRVMFLVWIYSIKLKIKRVYQFSSFSYYLWINHSVKNAHFLWSVKMYKHMGKIISGFWEMFLLF